MTYCLGLMLDQGLVFASDSRANARVDYVTTYSKMTMLQPSPDPEATPNGTWMRR